MNRGKSNLTDRPQSKEAPAPAILNRLKYWVPTILWMGVIFCGSSDRQSAQHVSRFFGPLIHWLFPHLSTEGFEAALLAFRKAAHVGEYAILSILAWWTFGGILREPGRTWRRAGSALLVVVVYAMTDELHQTFVPTRQGTPVDVLIDTLGGLVGLGAILMALAAIKRFCATAARRRQDLGSSRGTDSVGARMARDIAQSSPSDQP